MGKERNLRVYEDFQVGSRVECPGARQLTESDRATWVGLVGDPITRFADGSKRVHPLLVYNLAHAMVMQGVLSAVKEELGVSGLITHRPVDVGSTIHATCRVIGAREDPTKDTGVIWVRVAARDPRGVVLSYVAWFRVAKRHKQGQGPRDTLPTLQDKLAVRDIHTGGLGELPKPHETGGKYAFEDYVAGETIFHEPATHIEGTEIRMFARWFRLDRAVHHLPEVQGFRAPGGQAVGLAYALAHDGLQNRIGLGGVNAWRTPNPVKPGDTLRAMSQVVGAEALNPTIGAVRLRTFLFRGRVPMADDPPLITNGKRYYDHIAVDMDYWELLPTQQALSGR
ncbi:MAG: hypothetical protein H6736_17295 [Alphaproteobacteria bacterium]|nr:hypothetical protein [Alphaproteobacteria bacterium]